jgi:hypothetical protein
MEIRRGTNLNQSFGCTSSKTQQKAQRSAGGGMVQQRLSLAEVRHTSYPLALRTLSISRDVTMTLMRSDIFTFRGPGPAVGALCATRNHAPAGMHGRQFTARHPVSRVQCSTAQRARRCSPSSGGGRRRHDALEVQVGLVGVVLVAWVGARLVHRGLECRDLLGRPDRVVVHLRARARQREREGGRQPTSVGANA